MFGSLLLVASKEGPSSFAAPHGQVAAFIQPGAVRLSIAADDGHWSGIGLGKRAMTTRRRAGGGS